MIEKSIKQGESLRIGFSFNPEYDESRINDLLMYIDGVLIGRKSTGTISKNIYWNVSLSSDATFNLHGHRDLILIMEDSRFGLRKFVVAGLLFDRLADEFHANIKNQGYNLILNLEIDETVLISDVLLLEAIKGDKGDPGGGSMTGGGLKDQVLTKLSDHNLDVGWVTPLQLGNLSSNAFYGDKGLIAYNHSQQLHAPSDAEKNVNADWNSISGDSLILNKPTIPSVDGLATETFVVNSLSVKVDKVDGKSLVLDTEIAKIHLPHSDDQDLTPYQLLSEKGSNSGYAGLDINQKIPLINLPDSILGQLEYQTIWDASTGIYPSNPLKGYFWIISTPGTISSIDYNTGDWMVYNGISFDKVDNTDAVTTVAGRIGNIVLTKSDVGLNLVNNTSDLGKPVSNATQTQLDTKVSIDIFNSTLSYKEDKSNKITLFTSPNDAQYPSAKLVSDQLNLKVDKVTGSRLITSSEGTILGNTSGTNSGDNAANSLYSGLISFPGYATVLPLSDIPIVGQLGTSALLSRQDHRHPFTLSSGTTTGYLSLTDWNTFNNKVSFPGFGTTHVLAAYGDHLHTGVYQPIEDQRLSTTNSPTFYNITANQFIKTGGLANQFLMADGSVNSNIYSTNIHSNITSLNLVSGTNTGDNSTNSNYESDYRLSNFIAGANYQVPLVSGTNIKTIGGNSLLGSGDISFPVSYTLPTASVSILGGVKIGSGITITNGVISVSTNYSTFDGNYNSLSNKPALFSGSYIDLTNKPTLFSGSYTDLSNKPIIPSVGVLNTLNTTIQVPNDSESLSGTINLHKIAKTGNYLDLGGRPTNLSQFNNNLGNYGDWKSNINYIDITVVRNSSDFNSIRELMESITDASATKIYRIHIPSGRWFECDIYGKQYVELIGEGIDKTILYNDGTSSKITPSNYSYVTGSYAGIALSSIPNGYKHVIFGINNICISNLTIEATNAKYTCHLDSDTYLTFKATNCKFKTITPMSVIGIGVHSGQDISFTNCIFNGTDIYPYGFYIHNIANQSLGTNISIINSHFSNCGYGWIDELGSNQVDNISFINCTSDNIGWLKIKSLPGGWINPTTGLTETDATLLPYSIKLNLTGTDIANFKSIASNYNDVMPTSRPKYLDYAETNYATKALISGIIYGDLIGGTQDQINTYIKYNGTTPFVGIAVTSTDSNGFVYVAGFNRIVKTNVSGTANTYINLNGITNLLEFSATKNLNTIATKLNSISGTLYEIQLLGQAPINTITINSLTTNSFSPISTYSTNSNFANSYDDANGINMEMGSRAYQLNLGRQTKNITIGFASDVINFGWVAKKATVGLYGDLVTIGGNTGNGQEVSIYRGGSGLDVSTHFPVFKALTTGTNIYDNLSNLVFTAANNIGNFSNTPTIAGVSLDSKYLGLNGGSMNNTNLVGNLNAQYLGVNSYGGGYGGDKLPTYNPINTLSSGVNTNVLSTINDWDIKSYITVRSLATVASSWQLIGSGGETPYGEWYLRDGVTTWNTANRIVHSGNFSSIGIQNSPSSAQSGSVWLDGLVKSHGLSLLGTSGGYTIGDIAIMYFGAPNNDFGYIKSDFGDKYEFGSYHGYRFKTSRGTGAGIDALNINVNGDAVFSSTVQTTGITPTNLTTNHIPMKSSGVLVDSPIKYDGAVTSIDGPFRLHENIASIVADNGAGTNLFSLVREDATDVVSLGIGAYGGIGFAPGKATQDGTYSMFIKPSGNIGIGYSTGSEITNNKLSVNGGAFFNGAVTATNFVLSSDARLKTNILPISKDYSNIEFKEYKFKNKLGEKRFGVIAQDLLELGHDEFVVGNEKDGYSVKYIDLLIAEVSTLKNKVKQLEDKYGCS